MEQNLQDKLTEALIGLSRATVGNKDLISDSTTLVLFEGLLKTAANSNFQDESAAQMIERVTEEKRKLAPNCFYCMASCGKNDDYNMQNFWNADKSICSLKSALLFGLREMSAYALHALKLGYQDEELNYFFCKALFAIGMDDWGCDELLPIVMELGEMYQKCVALLNDN